MTYLLLTIVLTVLVFVLLKEFNRFGLDNFQAIVVNYFVAFFTGIIFDSQDFSVLSLTVKPWIYGAFFVAVLFIIVFNLMAITAQKMGLFVMTVAGKMSLIIPILAGVLLYQNSIGLVKILGIILALFGVWFTAKKNKDSGYNKRYWYLPFLIFVGAGIADTIINHLQFKLIPKNEFALFSTTLFLFCGLIGFVVFIFKLITKQSKLSAKSWLGGVILGFPNYFSIYFMVKALSQPNFSTAFVFSANNLLIVLGSVLIGVLLYKEKISNQNWLGLVLSITAIVILYFTV